MSNCLECSTSINVCSLCEINYFIFEGKCLENCPSGLIFQFIKSLKTKYRLLLKYWISEMWALFNWELFNMFKQFNKLYLMQWFIFSIR